LLDGHWKRIKCIKSLRLVSILIKIITPEFNENNNSLFMKYPKITFKYFFKIETTAFSSLPFFAHMGMIYVPIGGI